MKGSTSQFPIDCSRYPLRDLAQGCVIEMNVAVGRTCPSMPKQTSRDVQACMRTPLSSGGRYAVYSMVTSPPEERFGVWCCRVGTRWHRSRRAARTQLVSGGCRRVRRSVPQSRLLCGHHVPEVGPIFLAGIFQPSLHSVTHHPAQRRPRPAGPGTRGLGLRRRARRWARDRCRHSARGRPGACGPPPRS